MRRGALAALLFLGAGAASAAEPVLQIEALASPVKVRLRGLSAFSDTVAWASGREGTVLRTRDGGKHWDVFRVPGADALDFRDVQAFGADVALVMGAGPGDASRVYRTADGGHTWTLVLRNPDAEGFFDCMDFAGNEGRLLGDPVHGRFQVFASSDGGRSWRWTKGPKAAKDEAAFAASGTCLRRIQKGTLVVTGGAKARVHFLPDKFERSGDWRALDAEAPALPSSGLFSIAVREGFEAIAVGGDYKKESGPTVVFGVAATIDVVPFGSIAREGPPYLAHDGNDQQLKPILYPERWQRSDFRPFEFFVGMPSGYRSAIACDAAARFGCIATGPAGTDLLPATWRSTERQRQLGVAFDVYEPMRSDFEVETAWHHASDSGYDSVDIAGRAAWFSGDDGRLGRAELPSN